MKQYKTVRHLRRHLARYRAEGKRIGFVPTMGALHEGHLSLIRKSNKQTDITVCSIFVNPTQFNVAEDLEKYPRTVERDCEMLNAEGCDVVFLPSVREIYPKGKEGDSGVDFGPLERVMEGEHRPGHFAGVAQVLTRFLGIVQPDAMFMGQKDYQQFTIVRELLLQLGAPTELVMGETIREADGLAMSSRNMRLSDGERKIAPKIAQALRNARSKVSAETVEQIKKEALSELDIPQFTVEYFEIVDGSTLQPITSFDEVDTSVACTAVHLGNVRLIDNMILK